MTTESVVLAAGTFALYQDPDGSMVLSYRVDGETEDKILRAPAAMLKFAQKSISGGGGPLGMMARHFSRANGLDTP